MTDCCSEKSSEEWDELSEESFAKSVSAKRSVGLVDSSGVSSVS
jgi:hypothetical protein